MHQCSPQDCRVHANGFYGKYRKSVDLSFVESLSSCGCSKSILEPYVEGIVWVLKSCPLYREIPRNIVRHVEYVLTYVHHHIHIHAMQHNCLQLQFWALA